MSSPTTTQLTVPMTVTMPPSPKFRDEEFRVKFPAINHPPGPLILLPRIDPTENPTLSMAEKHPNVSNWKSELLICMAAKNGPADLLEEWDSEELIGSRHNQGMADSFLYDSAFDKDLMPIFAELATSRGSRDFVRYYSMSILSKHMRSMWNPQFKEFCGFLVPFSDTARKTTTELLLDGLGDSDARLRRQFVCMWGRILEATGKMDVKHTLVQMLFDRMIEPKLTSPETFVNGISRVLYDYVACHPSEERLGSVLSHLDRIQSHVMGRPDKDGKKATSYVRAQMIKVFRACIESAVCLRFPHALEAQIRAILPSWIEILEELLFQSPNVGVDRIKSWDGFFVKQEIWESLPALVETPFIEDRRLRTFLSCAVGYLTLLYPLFRDIFVEYSAGPPEGTESDDGRVDFVEMMCAIFVFMASALRSKRTDTWWDRTTIKIVVQMIFKWTHMTSRDEEYDFKDNPMLFVAPLVYDCEYSLRRCAFDLLKAMLDSQVTMEMTASSLREEAQRSLERTQPLNLTKTSEWWKPYETTLAILSSQAQWLKSSQGQQFFPPKFYQQFLESEGIDVLQLQELQFLQGGLILFAGTFAEFLPKRTFAAYLDTTTKCLEDPKCYWASKIASLEAIGCFYDSAAYPDLLMLKTPEVKRVVIPITEAENEIDHMNCASIDAIHGMNTFQMSCVTVRSK
ncbi:hypothetical protein BXZ70DRAFT_350379 [Cristinia sonorae]|uniref:Uncharacterized protein n=1 Tax=Cristinia sonorae TaxID=1940300 RepID=A0A8K0XMY3_9AGAR|nr:hypothetical protein BXZ70DRAFT_350379 [Cristinia sonorae]